MKNYYITFRSVTPAQRGERILKTNGISCTLQRTPKWMEQQGCGYSLRLQSGEISHAAELLRREGISMRRVYVQRADGSMEEIEA